MAVLTQGILGPFTGKVGGVVGARWKGINYAKGYAVPANPNTQAQQAQRNKFSKVQRLASTLLSTFIATFLNPFAIKMSGYNYFMQLVLNSSDEYGYVNSDTIITKGSLEPLHLTAATYNSTTGALNIVWDPDVVGNGTPLDVTNCLIVDMTDNSVKGYFPASGTRNSGSDSFSLNSGLTASNLAVFTWCSRGTVSDFIISDSEAVIAST